MCKIKVNYNTGVFFNIYMLTQHDGFSKCLKHGSKGNEKLIRTSHTFKFVCPWRCLDVKPIATLYMDNPEQEDDLPQVETNSFSYAEYKYIL